MESLILERSLGEINAFQFERIVTESLYYNIEPLEYPKFPLNKQPSSINSIDFDKIEQRFLLCGGANSSIKIFDTNLNKSKLICNLNKSNGGHEFGITNVKWWPFDNGMFLSSSYDGLIKVWDSNSLENVFNFNLDNQVNCFDINPTGHNSLIVAGSNSSHIRLLDLKTTSSVHSLSGHEGSILSCKWNPNDCNILATGSSSGEVRIWDIRRTDSCLSQLNLDIVNDKDFNEVGNKSRKIGIIKNQVKAHSNNVNGLCWFENGKRLISTGHDDKIRIWNFDLNYNGFNSLLNFGPFIKNKYNFVKSMILSPVKETEVQYLWYPSDNGEVLIFRIHDGKLVKRLRKNLQENARSCCITYSENNSATYFSGTVDGRIFVWGPKDDE